jgi:hypothetical protein
MRKPLKNRDGKSSGITYKYPEEILRESYALSSYCGFLTKPHKKSREEAGWSNNQVASPISTQKISSQRELRSLLKDATAIAVAFSW